EDKHPALPPSHVTRISTNGRYHAHSVAVVEDDDVRTAAARGTRVLAGRGSRGRSDAGRAPDRAAEEIPAEDGGRPRRRSEGAPPGQPRLAARKHCRASAHRVSPR